MLLARVTGHVWGTKQAAGLEGERILLLSPVVTAAGGPPESERACELTAIDRLGAGPGDLVIYAHSSRVRDLTLGPSVPTKAVVLAIVDGANIAGGDT